MRDVDCSGHDKYGRWAQPEAELPVVVGDGRKWVVYDME